MSTRHTSTPKGRFVLRADAIRPYNCGGRAVEGAEPRGCFVPTVSDLSESVLNSIIVVDFFKHL